MTRFPLWLGGVATILAVALAVPAVAQDDPVEDVTTIKQRKELEKQQRIDEYLRKKAEKQAREYEAEEAAEAGGNRPEPMSYREWKKGMMTSGLVAPVASGTSPTDTVRVDPKELRDNQERLLKGPLASDPETGPYLQRIDAGAAAPAEVAAFAGLLARRWYLPDAVDYYEAALKFDPANTEAMLNLGSVQLRRENLSGAEDAFRDVLKVDPNNGRAYYGLGAVLRRAGEYDQAVAAFVQALVLDPSLGDPTTNPQILNNDLALPVKMMVYERTVGGLGLPLVTIAGGELPTTP